MSRIDSIINVAKTYLGTAEGSQNHREIIDLYNRGRYSDAYQMTMRDPWCCAFVVACFVEAGAEDIIPGYAACDQMIHVFKSWNRWKGRGGPVNQGDIIFYDWNLDGSADHVGIVTQNQFGQLSVIEGNKSDAVGYRSIPINSNNIIGYGVPNYGASSGVDSTPKDSISSLDREYIKTLPLLQKGSKNVFVKVLQILLYYYQGSELEIDGDFGPNTARAVQRFQTEYKLEVDEIVGKETWTCLLTKAHK